MQRHGVWWNFESYQHRVVYALIKFSKMFLPENIDLAQSEKYILSIRLVPDGFSFCIFSPFDKSVFHYQQVDFGKNLSPVENIKKTFFEVTFFSQPFNKVLVSAVSHRYTPVPDEYFEKKNKKNIFGFNVHGECGRVLSNFISKGSYHILFDLDEELYSFLSRTLWNPSFFSYSAHLLPFFAQYRSESERKRCFVDFHDDMVAVACFSDEELLSVNTYSNKSRFDALYCIANVLEKQDFDQNSDLMIVSGDLINNKNSVDTLKQLIRNVELLKLKSVENTSHIPTDVLLAVSDIVNSGG